MKPEKQWNTPGRGSRSEKTKPAGPAGRAYPSLWGPNTTWRSRRRRSFNEVGLVDHGTRPPAPYADEDTLVEPVEIGGGCLERSTAQRRDPPVTLYDIAQIQRL